MNGMLAGVPAATFEGNPPDGEATLTGGYFWIVANAKSAFEGILEDPNDAVNWDLLAKAYCNVVKMYCAYVPYCAADGCSPMDGPFEKSMKYKACNHLDYVNGPAELAAAAA